MRNEELLQLAELALKVGCNLQEGQVLGIQALVEHAPLARAAAQVAYDLGARYVDVWYFDQHAKRARVRRAPEDSLTWTPPWLEQRFEWLAAEQGALLTIAGDPEPRLLEDCDPRRAGLDRMPALAARLRAQLQGRVNWTIVPYPTPGWAELAYGEPDVDRLWADLRSFLRLDRPDPMAEWEAHTASLVRRAEALTAMDLVELRYEGPGTELTVGLIPGGRWSAAALTTRFGVTHHPNLPTEEVFTSPRRGAAEGVVRASRPLALRGTLVHGLELTLERGRITAVRAEEGAEVVRREVAADPGAAYLGEVALVDGSSPIGRAGVTYFNTLLDENAACHIAYGAGIPFVLEDGVERGPEELAVAGVNQSSVHTDFMVGSPELAVDGVTASGGRVPLLREEVWQVP